MYKIIYPYFVSSSVGYVLEIIVVKWPHTKSNGFSTGENFSQGGLSDISVMVVKAWSISSVIGSSRKFCDGTQALTKGGWRGGYVSSVKIRQLKVRQPYGLFHINSEIVKKPWIFHHTSHLDHFAHNAHLRGVLCTLAGSNFHFSKDKVGCKHEPSTRSFLFHVIVIFHWTTDWSCLNDGIG